MTKEIKLAPNGSYRDHMLAFAQFMMGLGVRVRENRARDCAVVSGPLEAMEGALSKLYLIGHDLDGHLA